MTLRHWEQMGRKHLRRTDLKGIFNDSERHSADLHVAFPQVASASAVTLWLSVQIRHDNT